MHYPSHVLHMLFIVTILVMSLMVSDMDKEIFTAQKVKPDMKDSGFEECDRVKVD